MNGDFQSFGISRASISCARSPSTTHSAHAALPRLPSAGSIPAMPATSQYASEKSKRASMPTAMIDDAECAVPTPVTIPTTPASLAMMS